ncbi:glycosyltransferase family 4 protein [Variovorax sp. WS11]|uniref:glycosyltransferase family 4 protein n=1 Tax=Variovorax sp. WS11 TaxID=1105204 RepID=UPI001EF36DB8|nr:glycosyltransferase family 4 protein [Variovorax sp. WS11]
MTLRQRGANVLPAEVLDLFDDAKVLQAAGVHAGAMLWAPPTPSEVVDRWSAARFLIDLWRKRSDLRARFPAALTHRKAGGLDAWLRQAGTVELGLSEIAAQHLSDALAAGLSDRARQVFLANDVARSVLPHGLTPAGMHSLIRWFMRWGMSDASLRSEEIWWLFLEAAQNPERELMLAYAFTPRWQRQYPEGMTVFGRSAFAAWFAADYGASGPWTDASSWPDWHTPAQQIRVGYWARDPWQRAHPDAFASGAGARALLEWLAVPNGGLPEALRNWCSKLDLQSVSAELAKPGVNVIGHFCYPSGLRVSVESMVQAMASVGVSASLRDVRTDAKDDPHHVDFRGAESYDVTVIHTQPEPFFDRAYARAQLFERKPRTYRIAYWYWEFDTIPDAWVAHAQGVDEVWTATEFVAKGLREKLSVPVRTMFPGVKLAPYERRSKAYFGLSEEPFTFLFTFHMMSVMERKNPLGLIRAFKEAFREEEAVRLVLKTSFGDRHPAQMQELRDAAAGANVTIIDQVYNPDEVLSLMDACDAYVSLHRSEGLGLTMAEAMLMGKPVIATNFSGNVDFMDDSNSLLVPYKLVKLGKPIPPYDADLEWAEPSEQHAAELMRRVYDNQAWAKEVGARGKASAEANLSLEAAGRRIAARLEEIKSLRRRSRSAG